LTVMGRSVGSSGCGCAAGCCGWGAAAQEHRTVPLYFRGQVRVGDEAQQQRVYKVRHRGRHRHLRGGGA